MHASIDKETCIGCGLCPDICPEVFAMGDDGLADVVANPVPEAVADKAAEARDSCPVECISLND